jgi:hypothetical protein
MTTSNLVKATPEVKHYIDLLDFVRAELQNPKPSSDCKLCNSKFRDEAHSRYEKDRSFQSIFNFLKEKGEEISYAAVRKHLLNHFGVQDSENNIRDLAERLARWEKLDTSEPILLNRYVKLFDIEIADLLGDRSGGSDIRRKNVELASKLASQVALFKAQLKQLDKELKPVEVIFTNLHRLIEVKVRDSNSPEVKRVLAEIYEQISKDVGDMPLDGYQED